MTSPKCTTRALVRYLVHLVVGMATMFVRIVGGLCSPSQFQRRIRYNTVCTVGSHTLYFFLRSKGLPNLDATDK